MQIVITLFVITLFIVIFCLIIFVLYKYPSQLFLFKKKVKKSVPAQATRAQASAYSDVQAQSENYGEVEPELSEKQGVNEQQETDKIKEAQNTPSTHQGKFVSSIKEKIISETANHPSTDKTKTIINERIQFYLKPIQGIWYYREIVYSVSYALTAISIISLIHVYSITVIKFDTAERLYAVMSFVFSSFIMIGIVLHKVNHRRRLELEIQTLKDEHSKEVEDLKQGFQQQLKYSSERNVQKIQNIKEEFDQQLAQKTTEKEKLIVNQEKKLAKFSELLDEHKTKIKALEKEISEKPSTFERLNPLKKKTSE